MCRSGAAVPVRRRDRDNLALALVAAFASGRNLADEAALVDGASVWRLYGQIVLPLCKPAMAALAT